MREAGPTAKRRKVTLACEACRVRKSRCDGDKPQCGNCSQRHERCVYKATSAQLAETNEYIDVLVARVAELESQAQQTQDALSRAHTMQTFHQTHGGTSAVSHDAVRGELGRELSDRDALILAVADTQHNPQSAEAATVLVDTSSPVDGMGGDTDRSALSDTGEKFYGVSSSMSFMKQFYNMTSRNHWTADNSRTQPEDGDVSANEHRPKMKLSPSPFLGGPEGYSLMPRVVTDHFLDLYWNKVYHIYPFLHKATFMAAYEQLWVPASAQSIPHRSRLGLGGSERCGFSSAVFHCALNAMLVLGIQFSDLPSAQKHSLASTLTQRSKSQFRLEMFDDGSIDVVQTLLLLVQVFQFTTFPTRCWSTIGGACRLAQGLGLHLTVRRLQDDLKPMEVELRKRIWHSCLMLDMIVSMTLGRPSMLRYCSEVALPVAVDDVYLEQDLPQPSGTVSNLTFFVEATKLCIILGTILSQIYRGNETDKPDTLHGYGSFDRLLEVDMELSTFANQVSDVLNWTKEAQASSQRNSQLTQQANILRARYLHLNILLYRPSFAQFCKTNTTLTQSTSSYKGPATTSELSTMTASFAQCCSVRCVRSAIELIELTERCAASNEFGAWWYSMFYIRTAAMVIFLADACDSVRNLIGRATLSSSWQKCRTVLMCQLPQGTLVRTCLQALEKMHEHVLKIQTMTNDVNSAADEDTARDDGQVSSVNGAQPAATQQFAFSTLLDGFDFNADSYQFDQFGNIFNANDFDFAIDDFGMSLL